MGLLRHRYGEDGKLWVQDSNVWKPTMWTPLLKSLDHDVELSELAGAASAAGTSSPPRPAPVLLKVHDKFFDGLDRCKRAMSGSWYNAGDKQHKAMAGEAVEVTPVTTLLRFEREKKDGQEAPDRSRSPSPSRAPPRGDEHIFWLGVDSSAVRKMAEQSLLIAGQQRACALGSQAHSLARVYLALCVRVGSCRADAPPLPFCASLCALCACVLVLAVPELLDFRLMQQKGHNFVKIFLPAKTKSEIDSWQKDPAVKGNQRKFKIVKAVLDFVNEYARKDWLIIEDSAYESRIMRGMTSLNNDDRIAESVARLAQQGYPRQGGSRIDPCGLHRCALLTCDEDQVNSCLGKSLHYITLAQMQRFLYNLSKKALQSNSIPKEAGHLVEGHRGAFRMKHDFYDQGSRRNWSWGVAKQGDLPTDGDGLDWISLPYASQSSLPGKWIEKLQEEGAYPYRRR